MKIEIISASGYKYQGPHNFNSAKATINFLRRKFDDKEIEFETDIQDGDASVNIVTKLCGNYKLVANAIID